ncbi:MAG: thioesterase family protein [Anaerolineae bacterium]
MKASDGDRSMALRPGMIGRATLTVAEADTAPHIGSGGVRVVATPRLVALMEQASRDAVQPQLSDSQDTVGVEVRVRHLAPTPVGGHVTAAAQLISVESRRLTFRVTARDEIEKVAEGTHVRAIVDLDRFQKRVRDKAGRNPRPEG